MNRLILLLSGGLILAACASNEPVWGGRTGAREAQAVQAATVRWFAANYQPSPFLGEAQALCLVVGERVGRRDILATAQAARSENMDPPAVILARLRDVRPKVLPISECVHGKDLTEVLEDTGERAVVLGVSYPEWVTPNLARISATLRENSRNWFRYRCSLVRGAEGWQIRRCT